ncbi:hypothetical protein AB0D29_28415 [Streptomyces sp. NPDC048424]|uniref:hypothetical protein n=1 Tax=Streptomyces sp. NPDC048424 TaxID=3155265 RepID=UPI00342C6C11
MSGETVVPLWAAPLGGTARGGATAVEGNGNGDGVTPPGAVRAGVVLPGDADRADAAGAQLP